MEQRKFLIEKNFNSVHLLINSEFVNHIIIDNISDSYIYIPSSVFSHLKRTFNSSTQ